MVRAGGSKGGGARERPRARLIVHIHPSSDPCISLQSLTYPCISLHILTDTYRPLQILTDFGVGAWARAMGGGQGGGGARTILGPFE